MKKIISMVTLSLMILAVLFSVLPMQTALAQKAPEDVSVTVKNRTGGNVTVTLVGDNGGSYSFTYEPGMYAFSVPQGHYRYYASTPCGVESGSFNLNVSKILYFSCKNGQEITLTRPTDSCSLYSLYWYHTSEGESSGHWFTPGFDPGPPPPGITLEKRCTDDDPTFNSGVGPS